GADAGGVPGDGGQTPRCGEVVVRARIAGRGEVPRLAPRVQELDERQVRPRAHRLEVAGLEGLNEDRDERREPFLVLQRREERLLQGEAEGLEVAGMLGFWIDTDRPAGLPGLVHG